MKKTGKRRGYRLRVYTWKNVMPDVLTFYYMTEQEMMDWVEGKLSDPFSGITSIEVERFYYFVYEK